MSAACLQLTSDRLTLKSPEMGDIDRIHQFEVKNASHLKPWEVKTFPELSKPRGRRFRMEHWIEDQEAGRSCRFLLIPKEDEGGPVIGMVNLFQIFQGAFQACYLGFKIDLEFEGKGYMSEALRVCIDFAFNKIKLHRLMANHMPNNERSARLLEHLGFEVEGLAKDYLLINGKWEDHVLRSLLNRDWTPQVK